MPQMVDPTDALISFQAGFRAKKMKLVRGRVDPTMFVHFDDFGDHKRFTYARTDGQVVLGIALFVSEVRNDALYFDLGCAVREVNRNCGIAKSLVTAAIAELRNGFRGTQVTEFRLDAVISVENVASQKVAEALIGGCPREIIDPASGQMALHFSKTYEVDGD